MPHVIIKMYAGRTPEQKRAVACAVGDAMIQSLGAKDTGLTVDIQDIPKEEWEEKVVSRDIQPREAELIIPYGTPRENW